MTDPRILVLIPARMAATRLPGKPLLEMAGLPMIVHVLRRAEAARIGRVAVATDTAEIAAAVTAHGGRAVMTRADHPSGSDRIFEALGALDPAGDAEVIVNLPAGARLGLDPGDVVELPARADRAGLTPLPAADLPRPAAALVEQVKDYERGIVAAALSGDADLAAVALAGHPLVPGLTVARELIAEYRELHGADLAYLH